MPTLEESTLIVSGTWMPSGTTMPGKRSRSSLTTSTVRITCGWLTMYLAASTHQLNTAIMTLNTCVTYRLVFFSLHVTC